MGLRVKSAGTESPGTGTKTAARTAAPKTTGTAAPKTTGAAAPETTGAASAPSESSAARTSTGTWHKKTSFVYCILQFIPVLYQIFKAPCNAEMQRIRKQYVNDEAVTKAICAKTGKRLSQKV